jgi:hypothetical protein
VIINSHGREWDMEHSNQETRPAQVSEDRKCEPDRGIVSSHIIRYSCPI